MKDYLLSNYGADLRKIPIAPAGPVRTMAEWEQVQAVIITWAGHSAILKEIVRHAVKECKVLIIANDTVNVSDQLTNAGILLDSVQFVNAPFNSIWVRDYGPWTVYKNDADSLFLVDWIYNRPRPNDDSSPAAIAEHLGLPIYEATVDPDDLVHTGGNNLPDGMGTVFSSMLVLEENPDKTEDQIDSIAKKYMGVKQWIKFPTLPYDGIHHVDMHMRVIDEETIIFGEYPDGVADGPQINANIQYLTEEFETAFGNKFRILRIPMPPEGTRYPDEGGDYRTYTNSIFINKTILVPTYEEKYDTTALRIYRENLPGYNVVGINCNQIIPSLGALHCITKLVGVEEPLLIAHPRLRDSDDPDREYLVKALIRHRSGIEGANLFYRASGDTQFIATPMMLADSLENLWAAIIPPFPSGTEIHYYIHAKATNGKEQVRPIVAPEGYFRFRIESEIANQPPFVNITYPFDGAEFELTEDSVNIEVEAVDADGSVVELILYINGDSIANFDTATHLYTWQFTQTGAFELTVRARDDQGAFTVSEPVHITIENTTGIRKSEVESVFVFPNPVSDVLWMQGFESEDAFVLSDLGGRGISLKVVEDGSLKGLDFSGLPVGIYFLRKGAFKWRVIKL